MYIVGICPVTVSFFTIFAEGSGTRSGDGSIDPDADPEGPKTYGSYRSGCFFAYYFLKVHLHHFSKIKSHKEVRKQ
jgi:hypothetical protein